MTRTDTERVPAGYGFTSALQVEDSGAWVQLVLPLHELSRIRAARAKAEEEARVQSAEVQPEGDSKTRYRATSRIAKPAKPLKQPANTVPVFDWQAALARIELLESNPGIGDSDVVKRDLRQFHEATSPGPWRAISRPSHDELQKLGVAMPHFGAVVAFYERSFALADLSGSPPRPAPVLLNGSPGAGKTYFSQRLAEILHTTIYRQAFDNAQSNSALRGSERYWGNTAVGALWQLIVLGENANPVVLLDELDKCSTGNPHGDPVNALLTLLEPETARRVKDLSLDFEFDASFVIYIATVNDASLLSAPLRSRFTEFEIKEPDIDGRLMLAHDIFESTLAQMVPNEKIRKSFNRPTDMQICALAWMTPREIRKATEQALGAAALAKRWHFEDKDFEMPPHSQRANQTPPRRRDDGDDLEHFAILLRR